MFRIAIVEDQDETRECLNRFVRQYADFALLGGMIYLCTDINKKGRCTARCGVCLSRSAPTRAGAFWSCNFPGMDTR